MFARITFSALSLFLLQIKFKQYLGTLVCRACLLPVPAPAQSRSKFGRSRARQILREFLLLRARARARARERWQIELFVCVTFTSTRYDPASPDLIASSPDAALAARVVLRIYLLLLYRIRIRHDFGFLFCFRAFASESIPNWLDCWCCGGFNFVIVPRGVEFTY